MYVEISWCPKRDKQTENWRKCKTCGSIAERRKFRLVPESDLAVDEALETLLDQVDYTAGNCYPTEMVGAVLAKEVILLCRRALPKKCHLCEHGIPHMDEHCGNPRKRPITSIIKP